MFPNQIERAEILLNTNKLNKIIEERQKKIIAYENINAKLQDAYNRYQGKSNSRSSFLCCLKSKEPHTPQVRVKYDQ